MTETGSLDLFGTLEPPVARRVLRAGDLSAVLEDGNLRTIRFGDVEVLRAVNYLARDTGWGTYAPIISDLLIDETEHHFRVTYAARCEGPEGRFDYVMTIVGQAEGSISLQAQGRAITDFPTNRTGFVLLHPAEAAGSPLTIVPEAGAALEMRFPDAIDPNVPVSGIRAMTHQAAAGLTVQVAMVGDLFEMEDQRNWADASFKTYVRPLAKPRPYVIAKGMEDFQSITVTLEVAAAAAPHFASRASDKLVRVGGVIGTMPAMALFADRPAALSGDLALLKQGLAQHLILRWEPGQSPDNLAKGRDVATALGATPVVEAILPARQPDAEARALLNAMAVAGLSPAVLLVAPRREFKTSPTASLPAGEVTFDALVSAVRAAGFDGRIVAGTPSFFPEFNRNPPGPLAEAVYFGGCAIVHAADDLSVMETLSVYPAILASAAGRSGGRPLWLGPCTLGARHAPYGASVAANPDNRRIAMVQDDPRHKALFAAAYGVGLATACAGSAVECLTLAAPSGPFGLIGGGGQRYPLLAVQSVLATAAGCVRREIALAGVAAVAWDTGDRTLVLAANTGADALTLDLPATATAKLLLADAEWGDRQIGPLTLGPYRTALIDYSSGRDL